MPTYLEDLTKQRREKALHRMAMVVSSLLSLFLLMAAADKAYEVIILFGLTSCSFG